MDRRWVSGRVEASEKAESIGSGLAVDILVPANRFMRSVCAAEASEAPRGRGGETPDARRPLPRQSIPLQNLANALNSWPVHRFRKNPERQPGMKPRCADG